MIHTYRLGAAERDRCRALTAILNIPQGTVQSLDEHPITVKIDSITGNCLIAYEGVISCNIQNIAFILKGVTPESVDEGAITTGFGNVGTGVVERLLARLGIRKPQSS